MSVDINDWTTNELKKIIRLLVDKNYKPLNDYLLNACLEEENNIENFLTWLRDYCNRPEGERVITYPPDDTYRDGSIINERPQKYCKKAKREFWGCFDLWVDGERSDLTLEYEIEYYNDDDIRFYMCDIHVM